MASQVKVAVDQLFSHEGTAIVVGNYCYLNITDLNLISAAINSAAQEVAPILTVNAGTADYTVGDVLKVCDQCKDAFEPKVKVTKKTMNKFVDILKQQMIPPTLVDKVTANFSAYVPLKKQVEAHIEENRKHGETRNISFFYVKSIVKKSPIDMEDRIGADVAIAVQESGTAPIRFGKYIIFISLGGDIDPAGRDSGPSVVRFPPPSIDLVIGHYYFKSIGNNNILEVKFTFVSVGITSPLKEYVKPLVAQAQLSLEDGDSITSIKTNQIMVILVRMSKGTKELRESFRHKIAFSSPLDPTTGEPTGFSQCDDPCVGNSKKNLDPEYLKFVLKYSGDEKQGVAQHIIEYVLKQSSIPLNTCIFTTDGTVAKRAKAMNISYCVQNHGGSDDEDDKEDEKEEDTKIVSLSKCDSTLWLPKTLTDAQKRFYNIESVKRNIIKEYKNQEFLLKTSIASGMICVRSTGEDGIKRYSSYQTLLTYIQKIIDILIYIMQGIEVLSPPLEATSYDDFVSFFAPYKCGIIVTRRGDGKILAMGLKKICSVSIPAPQPDNSDITSLGVPNFREYIVSLR
jgi:hypothetical protein